MMKGIGRIGLIGLIGAGVFSGCSINRLVPPPWAGAIVTHARFFGLDATIPTGSATIGVKLGWGSSVWSLIPVSTNQVYSAPLSDTFRVGQQLSPFDTTITEDLQTGWVGAAPVPRLRLK